MIAEPRCNKNVRDSVSDVNKFRYLGSDVNKFRYLGSISSSSSNFIFSSLFTISPSIETKEAGEGEEEISKIRRRQEFPIKVQHVVRLAR